MSDRSRPELESSARETDDKYPSPTQTRVRESLTSYWNHARINLAKRSIRTVLKSPPTDKKVSVVRFRDVIEKRPAKLAEILECLNSERKFDRALGSVMFRAWIVDPADASLHRLALANAIRTEARRIEGRSAKRSSSRTPFEAMLLQASARLSARHAPFYENFYLAFGEASVERGPTDQRLATELHKRAGWLPEALAMLVGLHRMHDVALSENTAWSPSLLKGYAFAQKCRLRFDLRIFGSSLAVRGKARGKKTIEDNLRHKSLAPCIWYSAMGCCAFDGKPLPEVIGDVRVDLSRYLPELGVLMQRAFYVWEGITLLEYRDRCGQAGVSYTPLAFDAQRLDDADEKLVHSLILIKAGRPRN